MIFVELVAIRFSNVDSILKTNQEIVLILLGIQLPAN